MPSEIDVYGVFVPSLLVLMLLAFGLTSIVRGLLSRSGFYRRVWHRSMFNASIYIVMLGALQALAQRVSS
ncbi:DUF1656 domain-containing protein [Paraburkholderia xenovorans]|uniref:DUF1656 domain-containing protein n=1 Tax=Paraburkholderia xenovorans TaxID=36873 RepID=UPI0038B96B58